MPVTLCKPMFKLCRVGGNLYPISRFFRISLSILKKLLWNSLVFLEKNIYPCLKLLRRGRRGVLHPFHDALYAVKHLWRLALSLWRVVGRTKALALFVGIAIRRLVRVHVPGPRVARRLVIPVVCPRVSFFVIHLSAVEVGGLVAHSDPHGRTLHRGRPLTMQPRKKTHHWEGRQHPNP
jgi:hypothetical protein